MNRQRKFRKSTNPVKVNVEKKIKNKKEGDGGLKGEKTGRGGCIFCRAFHVGDVLCVWFQRL